MNCKTLIASIFLLISSTLLAQEVPYFKAKFKDNASQAFVYDILITSDNINWFATSNGVLRSTLNTDTVIQHPKESDKSNFVTSITGNQNDIIAGFFDGNVASIQNYRFSSSIFKLKNQIVGLQSNEEKIYAATPTLLVSYTRNKDVLDTLLALENDQITDLHLVNNQELIITTRNRVYLRGKQSKILAKTGALDISYTNNRILITSQSGISYYQNGKLSKLFPFQIPFPTSSAKDLVYLKDLKQYFIGSNEGLLRINLQGFIEKAPGVLNSARAAITSLQLNNNTLWIASYGAGVWYALPNSTPVYLENTKQIKTVANRWAKLSPSGMLLLGENTIFSQPKYTSNKNWEHFCFEGDVLYTYKENQLFHITSKGKEKPIANFPNFKELLDIYGIGNAQLAFAVKYHGLYIYDILKDSIVAHFDTKNGLLHNDVTQVLSESNSLWILSRESGISYYKDQKPFNYFTVGNGLPAMQNTAMVKHNGDFWISSEGGGISTINSNLEVSRIRVKEGDTPEYYYGLGASENGILIYSREELIWLSLQGNQIFPIPDFTKNVVPFEGKIQNSQNGFIIPCYNGSLLVPHKLFSSLNKNKKSIAISNATSSITGGFVQNEKLDFGKHEIHFEYELYSDNPLANTELEYMLEGYHQTWQHTSNSELRMPAVRFGDYSLKIKLNDEELQIFSFSVKPPFWRRPLFIVSFLILLVFIFLALLRWRTYRLKKQKEELEIIVKQRTKDLEKRNNELQQFTYAISHDLKNPASNIFELVEAFKEDIPDRDEETDFYINHLSKASSKLYQNLLDLLEVLKQANEGKLVTEQVAIAPLIEDIKEKISAQIAKSDARITVSLTDFESLEFNKVNLHSVLYNLISNGIKYAKPDSTPEIEISTFVTKTHWGISVKDNGLGIDLERNKDMLFGLFKRFHNHVEGSGVGLYLVNAIVEKNGGFIDLKSAPGEGSTFNLHLVPITT